MHNKPASEVLINQIANALGVEPDAIIQPDTEDDADDAETEAAA